MLVSDLNLDLKKGQSRARDVIRQNVIHESENNSEPKDEMRDKYGKRKRKSDRGRMKSR